MVRSRTRTPSQREAVRELEEEELIRQEVGERPVGEVGLALATARLNSCLQFYGLSSRELWTRRSQLTDEHAHSCRCPIINSYSPSMNIVPLTTPSERSPRTLADLSQIYHH